MKTVKLENFLQNVLTIEAEQPAYRLGGSAADGTCDCIGLIIGALRRGGVSWTGTHGTNYAARCAVEGLRRVTAASQLRVGEVVFKAREPGNSRYALPATYRKHADQRDYYHVGVVVSASPLRIVHCTTPTVKRDTALRSWCYAAALKAVPLESAEGADAPAEPESVAHASGDDCPLLRYGARGEEVRRMQSLLLRQGRCLPKYGADGVFGSETLTALRRFQAARGLTADGVCGPKTWAALQGTN